MIYELNIKVCYLFDRFDVVGVENINLFESLSYRFDEYMNFFKIDIEFYLNFWINFLNFYNKKIKLLIF